MATKENTTWVVNFSNYVVKTFEVKKGEFIHDKINSFLTAQNKGVQKSDRLYYESKQRLK